MTPKKPLIMYHVADSGWHCGYLLKTGYKWTRIQRILPKGSTRRVNIRVLTADTKEPTI